MPGDRVDGKPAPARPVPVEPVSRPLAAAVVVAATALSAGLGLYHLAHRSLWYDEGLTWNVVASRGHRFQTLALGRDGHLLPYYLVVHLLVVAFGDSVFVLRFPSVVAGVLAVPMIYLLGRRLALSRTAGMFAAALFAVSSPVVFWQQNARGYSFVIFMAVTSTWALVRAVQRGSYVGLVGWLAVTGFACYTHPESGFLVVAQLVAMTMWPQARAMWRFVAAFVATLAVIGIPVLVDIGHGPTASNSINPPPNWHNFEAILTQFASASGAGNAPLTRPDLVLFWVTCGVWVVGLGMLVYEYLDRGWTDRSIGLQIALTCLTVPTAIAAELAADGFPIFINRYLLVSLPAATLVAAMVLVRLRPRTVGIFGLLYLLVFRAGALAPTYKFPIDDYAGATSRVLAGARPGDCIAFYPDNQHLLYDYYVVHDDHDLKDPVPPAQVLPSLATTDQPAAVYAGDHIPPYTLEIFYSFTNLEYTAASCPRLWVLEAHFAQGAKDAAGIATYEELRQLRIQLAVIYSSSPRNYPFAGGVLQLYAGR